jgi:hypothetical protein
VMSLVRSSPEPRLLHRVSNAAALLDECFQSAQFDCDSATGQQRAETL